ncbi:hypothetical protein K469DRAFT_502391, partial [Zopfia rhizophila CBS 207.26]
GRSVRLFFTSQGHLGCGPYDIREGDEVWLLMDSRCPVILRKMPETKRYSLIGHAYLHGFMHGEMLDTG